MNYRHAYHAGNFADAHKHSVLALVVEHLKRKDAPFAYVDTHAGLGAYELDSVQAGKTLEWQSGIALVREQSQPPAELAPYLQAVTAYGPNRYPGSPGVVAALARPTDRLALCELHPEDCDTLRRRFGSDPRIGVHHKDGYEGLKALLPPPERRGVVLIDPPYEVKDEIARLRKGLGAALKRWPNGMYMVWYPIKARAAIDRFHADLAMLGLPKTLVAEVMVDNGDAPDKLNGSGLVLINPPYRLDEGLAVLLPWLAQVLAPGKGGYRLDWLVPEKG